MNNGGDTFTALFIMGVGIALYFLPSIAGWNKRNFTAILWLNILLGWTIIGWIVAFIWALTHESAEPKVIVQQELQRPILCAHCGKYSQPTSNFCDSCGQTFARAAAIAR
jgi:uncharacterized membrane protein YqaE (UPF0057 family)